jgi:hypothetical protein
MGGARKLPKHSEFGDKRFFSIRFWAHASQEDFAVSALDSEMDRAASSAAFCQKFDSCLIACLSEPDPKSLRDW